MTLKQSLGKNIQKYRKLNNITQEKLSEIIDVEINSISSIERGIYFPSADNLVKISKALNVTLSDLFNFKEEYSSQDYVNEITNNINLIKSDKAKLSAILTYIKSLI